MATAVYVGSAAVSGAVATRPAPVTNATAAGSTLLVAISVSAAVVTVSSVVDSQGNIYTLDGSFTTTLPYLIAYRSPGSTGGPTGGPTVALATTDTVTANTAAASGTATISVAAVAGAASFDKVSAIAVVGAAVTGSVSVIPAADGELIVAAQVNQATASALAVAAPFTTADSRQPGSGSVWMTWAYDQLAASTSGVSQTQTENWTGSSNWRGVAWALLPTVPALLPQQIRMRRPATFTRIAGQRTGAVYGR